MTGHKYITFKVTAERLSLYDKNSHKGSKVSGHDNSWAPEGLNWGESLGCGITTRCCALDCSSDEVLWEIQLRHWLLWAVLSRRRFCDYDWSVLGQSMTSVAWIRPPVAEAWTNNLTFWLQGGRVLLLTNIVRIHSFPLGPLLPFEYQPLTPPLSGKGSYRTRPSRSTANRERDW